MKTSNDSSSRQLYERAQRVIPGGVNSPVRAFRAVGGDPRFVRSASGCRIEDADGQQYIDYVGSWGPLILGHAHPEVVESIRETAQRGASYGAPTEAEVELAEKICRFFPSIEKVRLMSSGTEAAMTAIRLARAYTDRPLIVKFDGCYHGHSDSLLVQAGSGVLTLGLAGSPGIPEPFAQQTLSLTFGDLSGVEEVFRQYTDRIAAVILEPVPANMGVIPPCPDFLSGVIDITERNGAIAIFDEVITGFSARSRRGSTALQRFGPSDLPGEDPGRRFAYGGLWRTPRHHGPAGTPGSRLSGRNPFRKPHRRKRRNEDTRDSGTGPSLFRVGREDGRTLRGVTGTV